MSNRRRLSGVTFRDTLIPLALLLFSSHSALRVTNCASLGALNSAVARSAVTYHCQSSYLSGFAELQKAGGISPARTPRTAHTPRVLHTHTYIEFVYVVILRLVDGHVPACLNTSDNW